MEMLALALWASVSMVPSPATETRSLDDLINQLQRLGWIDQQRRTPRMERLVGWESVVVRTDDGWIYRFSRLDFESFDREIAVLAAVEGKLGVATPCVERVDAGHRLVAYRTLTGYGLDLVGSLALDKSERHDLVESLATTLAEMHDLTGDLPEHLAIPDLDCSELVETVNLVRPRLGAVQRSTLDHLLASWEHTTLAQPGQSRPCFMATSTPAIWSSLRRPVRSSACGTSVVSSGEIRPATCAISSETRRC